MRLLQSILVISHYAISVFSFFQSLPSLCNVNYLFPIPLFFFFFFTLFLPYLAVTLLLIIPLYFWHFFQPFPSFFGSSFSYYFTHYRYNSSNSFPPCLALFLPIIPHLTITIPSTTPLPFDFSPHFFPL
jgi:hypothetical protein